MTINSKIIILNWNARGIKNKKDELSSKIVNYDIVILTETKMSNKERLKFNGYNVIEKNYTKKINSAGGLAIIVRKDLGITKIKDISLNSSNIEMLGIKISGLDRELNCFAIYRRPGLVDNSNTWRRIISYVKTFKNVIIVGDFNAHNTIWNCVDTDKNGEILQEEMEEEGFFVINRSTKSRISEGGSLPSNIDLMFSSEDLFEIITYSQINDNMGSDHFPIEYQIKINKKRYVKYTNRITTKKTDWLIYQKELKIQTEKIREKNYKRSNMQERYRVITDILKEAIGKANNNTEKNRIRANTNTRIGNTDRKKLRKNPVSWWDEECRLAIEEKKNLINIRRL